MRGKDFYHLVKTHFVDSTAALASTHPIFAFFENAVLGMSDEVSINARLLATGITYFGMGSLFSRGRDLSKRLFKIKDTASEKIQTLHDTCYTIAFNAALSPVIYHLSGADTPETIKGTLTAMGLSLVVGPIVGYSIDTARDLTGIKKSRRIPEKISNLPPKIKKGLAALLLSGLVSVNGGIYSATPDVNYNHSEKNSIEKIISK